MKKGKKYDRSTAGLREMLFDALELVTTGNMTASEAVQLSSVVRQIVATADLELRVQKQMVELDKADGDAVRLAPPVVALSVLPEQAA